MGRRWQRFNGGSATLTGEAAAFRKGLGETGYVDGQNVTVEYHWLDGQYDRLPALMADLVRRRVAVVATPGSPPAAIAANRCLTVHQFAQERSALKMSPMLWRLGPGRKSPAGPAGGA